MVRWPPPPNDIEPFFAGRDIPCLSCGYNLRDTAADRCPECGTAIDLTLYAIKYPLPPDTMVALATASFLILSVAVAGLGIYVPYPGSGLIGVTLGLGLFGLFIHIMARSWAWHKLARGVRLVIWLTVITPAMGLVASVVGGFLWVIAQLL